MAGCNTQTLEQFNIYDKLHDSSYQTTNYSLLTKIRIPGFWPVYLYVLLGTCVNDFEIQSIAVTWLKPYPSKWFVLTTDWLRSLVKMLNKTYTSFTHLRRSLALKSCDSSVAQSILVLLGTQRVIYNNDDGGLCQPLSG